MQDKQSSKPHAGQPMVYQIKIKGHLGQQWQGWFEGLTITLESDGNTLLSGAVIDQSALHGILKKIRDLGMPLLSVNSFELSSLNIGINDNDQVNHEQSNPFSS